MAEKKSFIELVLFLLTSQSRMKEVLLVVVGNYGPGVRSALSGSDRQLRRVWLDF